MQYVQSRESADEENALWRRYVADSLFYMNGENKRFRSSFSEILEELDDSKKPAHKSKNADDIAADIIRRYGIKFERKEQTKK